MQPFHEQRIYQKDLKIMAGKSSQLRYLAHWHDKAEFLFVLNGRHTIGINEQKIAVKPGQIVQIGPWDIHYYENDDPISEAWLLIFSESLLGGRWLHRSGIWSVAQKASWEKMIELLENLAKETKTDNSHPDLAELSISGQLLCLMAQVLLSQSDCFKPIHPSNRGGQISMHQVLTYITSHFQDEISRDDTARHFGFSPAYFSRCFKAQTSLTFTEYITRFRLERAISLLKNSNQSIMDIAYQCGFNNSRTFHRAFRRIYSCQPRQIRELS